MKSLKESERRELLSLLEARQILIARNKIDSYYPDQGPLRRELYRKHLEFFRAGIIHRERCVLAANRIGKTESMGGYETVLHLTGRYPPWWEGRRFSAPISAWASGDTGKTTRDVIQLKLMGPTASYGTGLIPFSLILRKTPKAGLPDAIETIYVKHSSGGVSEVTLKSYDQGREAFQGTAKHLVWYDEEPPLDVYTEGLLRTMETVGFTGGMVIATFTPLRGLSEVVKYFLDIQAEETASE